MWSPAPGRGVAAVVLARSEAQVQVKDEGRDLAVLRLERPPGRPAVRFASVDGLAKLDTVVLGVVRILCAV
jgi:hypothetical protein